MSDVYKITGTLRGKRLPALSEVGGYTLIYIHRKKGDVLCADCATDLLSSDESARVSVGTFDEGDSLYCNVCNTELESSYGSD